MNPVSRGILALNLFPSPTLPGPACRSILGDYWASREAVAHAKRISRLAKDLDRKHRANRLGVTAPR